MSLRVLCVGDGNLSFARALLRLHQPTRRERRRREAEAAWAVPPRALPALALTASVYDSAAAQAQRYPESEAIAAELRRRDAEVLFNVDATDIQSSIKRERDSRASSTAASTSSSSSSLPLPLFDLVVFHQPHSGREDVRYHRALLSHFFASVLSVTHACSCVVLSLCNAQPERWQLRERAEAQGWTGVAEVSGRWEEELRLWVHLGYENRRHHTGKQFNHRAVRARHRFVFSRARQRAEADHSAAALRCLTAYAQLGSAAAAAADDEKRSGERPSTPSSSPPSPLPCDADSDSGSEDAASGSSDEPLCAVCQLPSSLHGVPGRVPPVDPSTSALRCAQCRAVFGSARALQQHTQRMSARAEEHEAALWREKEGKRQRQSRMISEGTSTPAVEERRLRRRARKHARRGQAPATPSAELSER